MHRKVLFRGRSLDDGQWVYGSLVIKKLSDKNSDYQIYTPDGQVKSVHRETVGQYIGQQDKEGVKIFEGDLISFGNPERQYEVFWSQQVNGWQKRIYGSVSSSLDECMSEGWVVVGNIFDNLKII